MEALWERICGYLNGFEGRLCDVFPEDISTVRPAAGIFAETGVKEKAYFDGTMRLRIPFVLLLRINAYSVRERLNAMANLVGFSEYMRCVPFRAALEGGRIMGLRVNGIPYRSKVFSDGSEEYRLEFFADVRLDSPDVRLEEEE